MSKLCEICGKEIPEGEEFVVDGQILCHEHFDEMYVECDCCGSIVPRDSVTEVHGGDLVCEDCLDTEYVCCEDCGEYFPDDDINYVNNGYRDAMCVCSSCIDDGIERERYFWCDNCEEYYTRNHLWAEDSNRAICDNCSGDYYVCQDCGDIVHAANVCWGDNDEPYCFYCVDRHADDSRAIHDYGYKPTPVYGTTDEYDGDSNYYGSELTFGVELECDKGSNPGAAAAAVSELTDRLYCKHDGSLDNGYEIVTHPGTLAWHMQRFPWKDICRESVSRGFKSHDAGTCGLHIHIGKDEMGDTRGEMNETVAKMILLVDVLWPEIVRFSRRGGESRWAHRNDGISVLDDEYFANEREAAVDIVNRSRDNRYLAVNVRNEHTVELRFNRGSLVPTTIYACLQLASNLTEFAMSHTMNECLDAKWDDIVRYHEYDELNTYVAKRFSNWTPDTYRPSTNFRFGDTQTDATTDLTDFEARCKLVTEGATYYDDDHELVPGDLVVLDADGGGVRYGSIGVVIRPELDDNWPLVMWNDTECHGLHNGGDPALPARCLYVARRNLRVIRTLRGGGSLSPGILYNSVYSRGLVPGDLVNADQSFAVSTHTNGVLYMVGSGVAYAAWPEDSHGHNGYNDMLAGTPYRRHGWNYSISDLTRV